MCAEAKIIRNYDYVTVDDCGSLARAIGLTIDELRSRGVMVDENDCLCNITTDEWKSLGARRSTKDEADDDPFVSWVIDFDEAVHTAP